MRRTKKLCRRRIDNYHYIGYYEHTKSERINSMTCPSEVISRAVDYIFSNIGIIVNWLFKINDGVETRNMEIRSNNRVLFGKFVTLRYMQRKYIIKAYVAFMLVYVLLTFLMYPIIFQEFLATMIRAYLTDKSKILIPYLVVSTIVNILITEVVIHRQVFYFKIKLTNKYPHDIISYYIHLYIFGIAANILGTILTLLIPNSLTSILIILILLGIFVVIYTCISVILSTEESLLNFKVSAPEANTNQVSRLDEINGTTDIKVYNGTQYIDIDLWKGDDIVIMEDDNLCICRDNEESFADKCNPSVFIQFKNKKVIYDSNLGKWHTV